MGAKNKVGTEDPNLPRSIRHKQILEVAAEEVTASMEKIAGEVPSANVDLVEEVLEMYGDPADKTAETPTNEKSMTQKLPITDKPQLSKKQLDTLRAIHENSSATQRELAEELGVTGATISARVNSIEGFDWDDREAFAEAILGENIGEGMNGNNINDISKDDPSSMEEMPGSADGNTDENTDNGEEPSVATVEPIEGTIVEEIDSLREEVTRIEQTIEAMQTGGKTENPFEDIEMIHKVLHACMNSDNISEEEELKILEELTN